MTLVGQQEDKQAKSLIKPFIQLYYYVFTPNKYHVNQINVIKKQFPFHQISNHHCNVRVAQKPIRAGFWSKVEGWMDWICDQG